jgi:hypothetical protein
VPLLVGLVGFGISSSPGQTNYFDGLPNTPLGNATLQTDSSGALVVSGIGSSGNDGVQIAAGGGGGTTVNLGVYNPDVLPADASLSWAAIGQSGGRLQQIDVKSVAGGGAAIFADFTGLGAPTVSVALYSNDTLVASASGIPPSTALATFTTAGTPNGGGLPMILNPCILNPAACYGNVDFTLTIPDPTGPISSLITLPGQGPVPCTRMQITPGYPGTPYFMFDPIYRVQATAITGRNLGSVYVEREGRTFNEFTANHMHGVRTVRLSAAGQAFFVYDSGGGYYDAGKVKLDNLGTNGLDGVDIDLYNANTHGSDLVALNPQPLPPGGPDFILSVGATGDMYDGRSGGLGTWKLAPQRTSSGGGWALSADLSPAGSAGVTLELWQGCSLVSSFSLPNGAQALTFSDAPTGTSVGLDDDGVCGNGQQPLPHWWWWVKWGGPVEVSEPGGSVFVVDHVRISPSMDTSALDNLTRVSYRMVGPQMLVLTNPAAQRLGLDFAGNQHFPIGQAALSTTATGQLNVGSLAAGGAPGVEITLSGANYGEISLPSPPSSGSISCEFHAALDNIPDRVAATLNVTANAAGETLFAADMSPLGATHYTILALNGGVQVGAVTNQPSPLVTAASNTVSLISVRSDIIHSRTYVHVRLPKNPGDPGPVIRLAPGLAVHGDEVIIMAEDAVRYIGPQNRVLVTGTGLSSFQLSGEELGYFGNGHTALGTAMLTADGGVVSVGHIGSSGNNGVGIDLHDALNASVSFAPIDFSAVQHPGHPGPWIEVSAFGPFGSQPNHDLGSLQFTAMASGGVQVTPDFSPVGALSHTIEVWGNGQLVQRVAGHTGNLGTVSAGPAGLGERTSDSPTGAAGCTASFGQLVEITIDGGPTLQGDELRVFPENPSQPIGKLQALNVLASGLDSFTIVGETLTPGLAPEITGLSVSAAAGAVLTVPTAFGYQYTVEGVDALGSNANLWTPVNAFFGYGAVQQINIPVNKPQQFFRLGVHGPGM